MPNPRENGQALTLDLFPTESFGSDHSYPEVFRKLYFHLYTNSNASRPERLLTDLSLILLAKLADELCPDQGLLQTYLRGTSTANEGLLPALGTLFPEQFVTGDLFHLDETAVRESLQLLRGLRLSTAPTHILGEAFQALIGPRLRGERGQFFTPHSLVRAMVTIVDPQPGEAIVDPACGTRSFLLHAFRHQQKGGAERAPRAHVTPRLFGADKDHDLARLATALLAITTQREAKVANFNSLELSHWRESARGEEIGIFDVVLTNPPFGARIPLRDIAILKEFSLGRCWVFSTTDRKWHPTREVRTQQDPQVLFLELCVRLLSPGGRMAIILPEGVFGNKESGYVWDYVRSQGTITALLDCPRTTFQPGTDTKTNVLFFRRNAAERSRHSAEEGAIGPVQVAVALRCGHDRRGRNELTDGTPVPDDFGRIADAFNAEEDERNKVWYSARITNPYYLVPRFYDRHSEEELRSLADACGGEVVTLGDLVSDGVLGIRKGHEVGAEAYGTGPIPFVRTSDISNWEVSSDPTKSISDDVYRQYRDQQRLQAGDVLLVCDGRYRIGKTAILHEHTVRCVVQSHFRIISSHRPAVLSPYGLIYLFNLPAVQRQLRNLVFIQSTLGTLGGRLMALKLPLYPQASEHAVAEGRLREIIERRAKLLLEAQNLEQPAPEL